MHERARCTPGLRFCQWMMEKDRAARLANQRRVRELKLRRDALRVVCSHDVREFEEIAGREAQAPAPAVRPRAFATARAR
jgi:hypothetical protein